MEVQRTMRTLRAWSRMRRDPSRFLPPGASQRKTGRQVRLGEWSEAAVGEDHAPAERLRTKQLHPCHSAPLPQWRNAKLPWAIPSSPGLWWAADDVGPQQAELKVYPQVLSRIPHTSGNFGAWALQH